MTDSRLEKARQFFKTHCPEGTNLEIAFADASHRRYLRGQTPDGSVIIMDAPPEKEPVDAFLQIQQHLARHQQPVPQLWAKDREHGFLLLEDLGDTTLFSLVKQHGHTVNRQALLQSTDRLIELAGVSTAALAAYDKPALKREISLFTDWYIPYRCQQSGQIWRAASADLLAERCDWLCTRLAALPPIFVHRDYHSRNLMQRHQADDPSQRWVMIDFQDAIAGPLGYDLISLLRDSYIAWPETLIQEAEQRFYHSAREKNLFTGSFDAFTHQLGMIAAQRHLKVLGIFVRLAQRDGKNGYLADLPLTHQHLERALARVPELTPLQELIHPFAPPVS